MQTTTSRSPLLSFAVFAFATLMAACADTAPLAPELLPAVPAQRVSLPEQATADPLVALRRSTARYNNIKNALDDDFVFLHPCEVRPGEGNVGVVYINFGRMFDGKIDPEMPDGLVYEQGADGQLKLAAAEFAEPNTGQAAPTFLGNTFQREDEFGVFGLHVWLWENNPNGLFAEGNPNVSCVE